VAKDRLPGDQRPSLRAASCGGPTGPRADHVTGRTRGKTGHTPVVRTTGVRFGLSVMSALGNQGRL
jgi:hypothetical protein